MKHLKDPTVGDTLIKKVRKEAISVWEFSITTIEQATRAKQSGAGAVLIGQGLVQNENPTEFIRKSEHFDPLTNKLVPVFVKICGITNERNTSFGGGSWC